jgi:HEAT repeats
MVLQHTAAHIRIKAYPPEPLIVHRGLQRLDFLPGFLGPTPLFDTGLTAEDIPSNQRSSVEAMTLRPWDASTIARMSQLFKYLHPESAARWWFYAGDWAAGSQAISSMTEKDRSAVLEMAAHIVSQEAAPSLLTIVTTDKPPRVRAAALLVLGQIDQEQAADVVPALVPLLQDPAWEVRQATAGALARNWLFLAQQVDGKPTYRKLMSQLNNGDSQRDARYRMATVQALALWYNAGRPGEESRGDRATAQRPDAAESANSQAQREHVELQRELKQTCYNESHLWLRSAACQVWIEAYRLRALP